MNSLKQLLPVSITLGGVPVVLSPQDALQDQQIHLTQVPFKLLPLCWDLEHVDFVSCPVRAASLFPTALQLSHVQVLLPFKARCSGAHLSGTGSLYWRVSCEAQTSHLWRTSELRLSSYFQITDLGVCLDCIAPPTPPHPSHCGFLLISLVVGSLFC